MAYSYGLLWLIYGLLWGLVACYFGLLGVPGRATMIMKNVRALLSLLGTRPGPPSFVAFGIILPPLAKALDLEVLNSSATPPPLQGQS